MTKVNEWKETNKLIMVLGVPEEKVGFKPSVGKKVWDSKGLDRGHKIRINKIGLGIESEGWPIVGFEHY